MRRFLGLAVIVLVFCCAGRASAAPLTAGGVWDDQLVEKAIARGTAWLWSQQGKAGNWPTLSNGSHHYPAGATAIAVYALLESGVSVDEPRMAKALAWLKKAESHKVYTLGLRCYAWLAADRQRPGMYKKYLRADAVQLLRSVNVKTGGWHYDTTDRKRYHNSTSQYGVLGVWCLDQAGGEVPRQFWDLTARYWISGQQADGGWGYQYKRGGSTGSMSTAGVASLFVSFDNLFASSFVRCGRSTANPAFQAALTKGLGWFDRNFYNTLIGKAPADIWNGGMMPYYLYGVERVGLAAGYKYFGSHDWYKLGARCLLGRQEKSGRWRMGRGKGPADWSIAGTAYSILFLVRGRQPVAFNKLEFTGDWNNRPRDLANLTRWMRHRYEEPVHWQTVSFRAPAGEWLDAPIIYISGAKAPKFTDAEINRLRTFVYHGGTILSVTECRGAAFKKGMVAAYGRMFPGRKLTPCPPGHDLYKVNPALRARTMFQEISNGARPLAIHVDEDISLKWQLVRRATGLPAFEAAASVFLYVTDKGKGVRKRGTTLWPHVGKYTPKATVKLMRIRHKGNYDPEPLALARFARLMARDHQIRIDVAPTGGTDALASVKPHLAVLTGTGPITLDAGQIRQIKAFVDAGGTLFIDAAGGDARGAGSNGMADSVKKMLARMYPDARLRTLAASAPLFNIRKMNFKIARVTWRRKAMLETAGVRTPMLKALVMGDRPGVIFSRYDVTAGLVGCPSFGVLGYSEGSAAKAGSAAAIMRNVAVYAAGMR